MPLPWVSLSFIAGIMIASLLAFSANLWLAMMLALLFIVILFRLLSSTFRLPSFILHPFIFILPISFLCGAWWYQFRQPAIDAFHIAFYNDRDYEILVTGTLAEPPDYRDTYTNLHIKVEAVDSGSGDLPARGAVLVRVPTLVKYEYGERVRVRGDLKTPPEDEEFSYRDYLAREGIHSYMSIADVTILPGNGGNLFFVQVYKLKDKLLEHTYRLYHDPEASLMAGILLGVDTGLTRDLQNAFKNTGTSHIIAISGFNIAIIAGIFFSIFKNMFGERLGAAFAILGIIFYTLLVGADAAVVRAAFMGSISLLARQLGRRNDGMNALALVALIMTIFNPLVIWDVGFQLSFFATLGLILYAEPFSNFTSTLISKISKQDTSMFTRIINDNVVLTFAAQLTTIPIMAYHFKRISLISFIANPFILPVQPAVMVAGGLAVFTSLVIFPLGQLIAWVAWPFASYTIRIVELFDRVPYASIYLGDSSFGMVLAFYIALLSVTFNWQPIKEWISSLAGSLRAVALTATLALLFICMIMIWRASATTGDGQLHITFLEAGSADAVLIQTPEGRNILINGGASTSKLSDELGRRLPFFSRKLDWLIIASTQEEQLAALPRVLERYPPENVLWSGNVQASFPAQALDKFFAEEGIPVSRVEAGQRLELGDGAFIEIQAVGPKGSVVLIQYENFRALLPIGMSEGMLEELEYGNVIGNVDVLLLADSGYAPSNPPDIIENVNPKLVVLSVAAGDPNGLPSESVLESLDGFSVLRTDRSGWISVITDGDQLRVEVERSE
ncbi:MAG: ComEC/Rec2 family competence protein [Anaerolineales bacterium]|uniref:ComEC/Rec2 family competence protein n=1 Tax=Candidatus Villigracilis proximus TaxID=3140683 RepID=UPI003134F207|nr:ComEC/Rec2 family competence protein [Anaerolineales bacterium]